MKAINDYRLAWQVILCNILGASDPHAELSCECVSGNSCVSQCVRSILFSCLMHRGAADLILYWSLAEGANLCRSRAGFGRVTFSRSIYCSCFDDLHPSRRLKPAKYGAPSMDLMQKRLTFQVQAYVLAGTILCFKSRLPSKCGNRFKTFRALRGSAADGSLVDLP